MTSLGLQNIYKNFSATHHQYEVLRNLSFEAVSGDIVGLVGPNGAGKTTTFQLLIGNEIATSGDIVLNGSSVTSLPIKKQKEVLRSHCSLLPENPSLSKYKTGKEIVIEYGYLDRLSNKEVSERIMKIENTLPLGCFWERQSLHYSKGQAELISLARVMMIDRPIVLLDEPTSGLDFQAVQHVHSYIKELSQSGKIVIVSTHMISDLLKLTQNIVGLDKGTRVSEGVVHSWVS